MIGHGNVAIDVARMLLKSPDALAHTDMPSVVVDKLRASRIRKVSAVGRRGPAQVSFTTKEFREMVNLPGVGFTPIDEQLMADARRMVEGDRARKRLMDLLSKSGKPTSEDATRSFELGFLKSPQAFLSSAQEQDTSGGSLPGKVTHIQWSLNTLLTPPTPPPHPPHPPAAPATSTDATPSTAVVARPTGESTTTRAGLVIESVGYRSECLSRPGPGQAEAQAQGVAVPFDEKRGRIVNEGGRVVDESGIMVSTRHLPAPAPLPRYTTTARKGGSHSHTHTRARAHRFPDSTRPDGSLQAPSASSHPRCNTPTRSHP